MKERADVVIIGGGVHGTSIAYHLAKRGGARVILLEKRTIASGPTAKTFGLIRQHYSYPFMVRIVKESLAVFRNFENEVGVESDFVGNGFLLLGGEQERSAMESIVAMERSLGVSADILHPARVRRLIPGISLEGVAVACYERNSGFADGYAVAMGFANKARELGVTICENRPALGIRRGKEKVISVITADGDIETPNVVNAAGPWAKQVASWVGIDLPIELDLLQEALVRPKPPYERTRPTVIDLCSLVYFRPETGGTIVVGGGEQTTPKPNGPDDDPRKPDEEFIYDIAARLRERMPRLADAEYVRGWAGLIDKTPDYYPIVGSVEEIAGFILSCGYSGHGFKEAPMMGKLVAEEILDGRATSIDISALNFARFRKGALLKGRYEKFPILA